MNSRQFIWFALYVLVGVYLLNINFNFFAVSETISAFDNWVIFAGGLLCIFGAITHFRLARVRNITRRAYYN